MKYKIKIESEFEIEFPDGEDFEDVGVVKDWIWRSTMHAAQAHVNSMGTSLLADSYKRTGGTIEPLVQFHIDKDNEIAEKANENFKIEVLKV